MAILKTYDRQVQTSAQSGAGRAIDTGASQMWGAVGGAVQTVAGVVGERERVMSELNKQKNELEETVLDARAKNITSVWNKTRSDNLALYVSQGFSEDEVQQKLSEGDVQYDADMAEILMKMPSGKTKAVWEETYNYGKNVTRNGATSAIFQTRKIEKTLNDGELEVFSAVKNGNTKLAKETIERLRGKMPPERLQSLEKQVITEDARQKRQIALKAATFAIDSDVEGFEKTYDPTIYTDDQNVIVQQHISGTKAKAKKQSDDVQSQTFTSLIKKINAGESITSDLVSGSTEEITVAGGYKVSPLSGTDIQKVLLSQKLMTREEEESKPYLKIMQTIKDAKNRGVTAWDDVDCLAKGLVDKNNEATLSEQTTLSVLNEIGGLFTDGKKFNPEGVSRTFRVSSEYSKAWGAVVDTYTDAVDFADSDTTASFVADTLKNLKEQFEEEKKGFNADEWIRTYLKPVQIETMKTQARNQYGVGADNTVKWNDM